MDQPVEDPFLPSWKEGQWWVVEYASQRADVRKIAHREYLTGLDLQRYTVTSVSPLGVTIRRELVGGDDTAEMTYWPHGPLRSFKKGVSTHDKFELGPIVSDAPNADHAITSWPQFPVRARSSIRTVEGPMREVDDVIEEAVLRDGDDLRILLRYASPGPGRLAETMVVDQRWERGRPWWSSATIEEYAPWYHHSSYSLEMRGQVVQWWDDEPAP